MVWSGHPEGQVSEGGQWGDRGGGGHTWGWLVNKYGDSQEILEHGKKLTSENCHLTKIIRKQQLLKPKKMIFYF